MWEGIEIVSGGTTSIVLVGIGGYGNTYVDALLAEGPQMNVRLVGAVDPTPTQCRKLADLQAKDVPIFPSMDAFYKDRRADLAIVSTPLHMHADHTCLAMEHGSHAFCEKPVCVSPSQLRQMIEARDRTQKHVGIGFQWSFSRAVQRLKRDVLTGKLGKPVRMRTMVLWPRDQAYYSRNGWAGKKCDAQGQWILDSPVNNACAHYLHNMFYLQGPRIDRSAMPARLTAELYRAHAIDNYDTAALRCWSEDGIESLFLVSHATAELRGPVFSYEFENGVVNFSDEPDSMIVATFTDGSTKNYGDPNDEPRGQKIVMTIEAIAQNAPSVCGIEAAAPQAMCTWAAQQSMPEITPFPQTLVRHAQSERSEAGSRKIWADGLSAAMEKCFQEWKLPSELGLDWARPGREVRLREAGDLQETSILLDKRG